MGNPVRKVIMLACGIVIAGTAFAGIEAIVRKGTDRVVCAKEQPCVWGSVELDTNVYVRVVITNDASLVFLLSKLTEIGKTWDDFMVNCFQTNAVTITTNGTKVTRRLSRPCEAYRANAEALQAEMNEHGEILPDCTNYLYYSGTPSN